MDGGATTVGAVQRSAAALMAALILVATVGFVVARSAKPAGANTVFASGQVFASVGGSQVYTFDPTSGNFLSALTDNSNDLANANPGYYSNGFLTVGSAFDAHGNFYVTDDNTLGDTTSQVSEFGPNGNQIATFPGLQNPISIAFDNTGDMYVGQQLTPYIAEFGPDGTRLPDIGPVTHDFSPGVDSIDLSSDQCTIYYTTEGTSIFSYNKCTNTQGPVFNQVPFPSTETLPGGGPGQNQAFAVKILTNGNVLVADSGAVLELDPTGNVIGTYPCTSMSGCGGHLFALSIDPSGTSFWTGDADSGNIYQINLASGAVMRTITGASGTLFGLSVDNQLEVATSPTTVAATPTAISVPTVSGNFSSPTPVSAVLTDSSTNTPIAGEPVTFTLNGTETCTAISDSNGIATCVITPGEPSQSYTLTASFPGDTSQSTPIGADSSSNTFTVTPDSSTASYTGPSTVVNGQPITLTDTLTTDTPTTGTPLPTKVETFTIGSGPTAQSCSGTTDANGNASCTIPVVNQPVSNVTVTSSFGGDVYDTPASTTTPLTVTEPTTLTVSSATGDFADATTVSGVLTDTLTNTPVGGEPVTLALNSTEACTGTTDASGTATCSITPGEAAATYPLTGSFSGDAARPLQLMPSNGSANFIVTLEQTSLSYTGATIAHNGQPLAVSGVLTTDDPALGAPIAGRTVTFTLGTGSSAQSCAAVTDGTGTAACSIASVNQSPGPIPVVASFAGDAYYQTASAASTVNLPEGTQLTINPTTGAATTARPRFRAR